MVSYKSYLKALHGRFGLLGAWPPNQRVEPGDIGVLEDGALRRVSALHHLGVEVELSRSPQPGALEYSEGAEVQASARAGGQAPIAQGAPAARGRVRFSRSGGFLFSAAGLVELRISDTLRVQSAVLDLFEQGRWEPDWVIVDRVLEAESLTVLISQGGGLEVDLEGAGAAALAGLSVAGAEAGLALARSVEETLRFQGGSGLTPLYGALRLDRRLVRRDRLEAAPLSFAQEGDEEDPAGLAGLEEVAPQD